MVVGVRLPLSPGIAPSSSNGYPCENIITCMAAFQGSTPSISGSCSESSIFSSEAEYATAWDMLAPNYHLTRQQLRRSVPIGSPRQV